VRSKHGTCLASRGGSTGGLSAVNLTTSMSAGLNKTGGLRVVPCVWDGPGIAVGPMIGYL